MIGRLFIPGIVTILLAGCAGQQRIRPIARQAAADTLTGTRFFTLAGSMNWQQRDSLALHWFEQGAIPRWWYRFSRIRAKAQDAQGKKCSISYWVSPDYLVLGTASDWVRVPLTPMAAQQMMDRLDCIFPSRLMTDQVYAAARIKLPPVPMYAYRDSGITMYQHHLIIEGQRKGQRGLIAGIKKDVVTTYKLPYGSRPNRVAIYGWHKPDGKPIQPLYTGHVNWYVDYSHGIRFVSANGKLNGKRINIRDLLQQEGLRQMLCNEDTCGYYRY
ncbi:MAG: hypothetical protein MUF29_10475 [Chitinophagaceae bacterium]|nr:hypothetical protein [Chitinophagaceae bacterium]